MPERNQNSGKLGPMKIKSLPWSLLGIGLTLLFALIAELFRFQGFLLLDLFVPIFVAAYFGLHLLRRIPLKLPKTILPALLFVLIGFASLLINSVEMSTDEFLKAAFYGVRWIALYLLCVIVGNEAQETQKRILWMVLIFSLLLSVAGFIQLKIFPDFSTLEDIGWDPHQNRLLSTWFDPNFVGGFIAFLVPTALGTALDQKKTRPVLLILSAVLLVALFLTLSRSAYLALLTGLLVFGLLKSWKLLLALAILFLIAIPLSDQIQNRVQSLYESASSVFTETYQIPDASARHRFASWEEGWVLFLQKPLLGHGYNRYEYAALELGTLKDPDIHSASGSDWSLLTILATTGLLGFLPFLAVYAVLLIQAWQNRHSPQIGGFHAGFFAGLLGLFVHSIFVNSLLFPLLLAPFWIVAGLVIQTPQILPPSSHKL